jgi:hypothetical protein
MPRGAARELMVDGPTFASIVTGLAQDQEVTTDGHKHTMDEHKQMMAMSWSRFAAMIGTSTFVMFFLM